MKKIMTALVALSLLTVTACGRPLDYNGRHYDTVGLINDNERDPKICYKASVGNVIWGIILIESLIFPVYFFGFSMYNPVGPKNPDGTCSY